MKRSSNKSWLSLNWPQISTILVELSVVIFFIALVVFKFWPILSGQRHFVQPGDTADLIYSDYVFVARSLKNGDIPLWNPHLFAGLPISSYPQIGLFYPFNWLFWLLPYGNHPFPYQAYEYLVMFHVGLSGWFAYLAIRGLKLSRAIGVLTGIIYMLTPNILLYIGWGSQITAFAWYPLLVLFLARTFINKERIHAYTTGLVLGILILAAPAQPAIMALMLSGFFIAIYMLHQLLFNRSNWLALIIPTIISAFILFVTAIAISAVSLLPIMEFAPRTMRFLGVDGDVVGKQKIPMHALLTYRSTAQQLWGFIMPDRANTPMAFNYYGLVPFLVAIVAGLRLSIKKPLVFFTVALSLFAVTYALGKIFPFIFYHIPFLNLVREPNKYLFFVSVMISFLFAYGADFLWQKINQKPAQWKIYLGLCILSLGLFYWQKTQGHLYAQLLIVGLGAGIMTLAAALKRFTVMRSIALACFAWLLIYDLSFFQMDFTSNDKFAVGAYLKSQENLLVLKPAEHDNYRMVGIESPTGWPYGFDAAGYLGLYDVFAYGNPVYFPFMDYRSRNGYCGKLYDMLNTKYMITYDASDSRLTNCGGTLIKTDIPLELYHIDYQKIPMNDWVQLHVYENTNRLGIGHLVRSIKQIPQGKDPIRFIDDHVSIATEAAIIDGADYAAITNQLSQIDTDPKIATDSVKLVKHDNDIVTLTVEASRSALLVSSDMYYPGWRVTVNGQNKPLYEVNYILRSVMVPAGVSTVEFSYHPAPVFTGLKLMLVTLLIITSQYYFYYVLKKPSPVWHDNLILALFLLIAGCLLLNYIQFDSFNLKRYDLP